MLQSAIRPGQAPADGPSVKLSGGGIGFASRCQSVQEVGCMRSGWVKGLSSGLQWLASATTLWVGSSWAFMTAALITLVWLTIGPIFHYTDTWQLVMNTISSIVTFLMVFLLQRSQNKEFMALQIKLNELIAAKHGASNRLIDVEDLTEQEVYHLHDEFRRLAERLRARHNSDDSVSIQRLAGGDEPGNEQAGGTQA
jgi:low affinity Fe/Cu permease